MDYNPNSTDALFSRVMNRLDQQDDTLRQILEQCKKTNGRVSQLEQNEAVAKGKLALVSALVSAAVGFVGWLWSNK